MGACGVPACVLRPTHAARHTPHAAHHVVCQQLHHALVQPRGQPVLAQLRLQRVRQRPRSIGQRARSQPELVRRRVARARKLLVLHSTQRCQRLRGAGCDGVAVGVVARGVAAAVRDAARHQGCVCAQQSSRKTRVRSCARANPRPVRRTCSLLMCVNMSPTCPASLALSMLRFGASSSAGVLPSASCSTLLLPITNLVCGAAGGRACVGGRRWACMCAWARTPV
jgi:hypothetical protein